MRHTLIIFSILSILFFTNCKNTIDHQEKKSIISPEEGKLLDSLLTPYVLELRNKTDNAAAIAIGITKGDEIIYAKSFGYTNVVTEKEANLNTRFHIASLSKPFTAAAVVKLVEQGKMQLDDLLIKHVPEFKMKGNGFDKITIRHILNHTSGIPRHLSKSDWENPIVGDNALKINLERATELELDFEPGSKFNYSNAAFDILGLAIENASQVPFDQYVIEHLLRPAGMNHSSYSKHIDKLPENWSAPHSYALTTQIWEPYPYSENYYPSSGLHTTTLDLCKWGIMHYSEGQINTKPIIDKDHFALLIAPQYDTPWGDKIGLSWFLQSYLDRPIIMHTGSDTGFEAIMYIYPEEKISINILSNRDFSRTGRLINAASEILFGQEPKTYEVSAKYPFAKKYTEAGLEEAKRLWKKLELDTTDIYYFSNDDILSTGAILENGQHWQSAKEILEYYLTFNDASTYAWRLLGNANLNLGDTLQAKNCYEKTLKINPNYEQGQIALDKLR